MMFTTLNKSAKKIILTALATVVLAVGAVTVLANTVEYLGSDDQGNQYYLGCGSSSGDYIMVYNSHTGQRTFYNTTC
jgi:hypothetical protein